MKKGNRFAKTSLIFITLFTLTITSCEPIKSDPVPVNNCRYELATKYHTAYDFGSQESKYIYVLLDQAYDSKQIAEDLQLLSEVIITNMFPGDKLTVAWINLDGSEKTIVFDERIERVELPQFPPTPIAPSLIQTLPPSNITTTEKQEVQTNQAVNKDINEKYFCEIGEWNAASDDIYEKWQHEQKIEMESFYEKVKFALTPIARYSYNSNLIYESLSTATDRIQLAITEHQDDKYILIIFSNMYDWRPSKPKNMKIDLEGINTLIVSQKCRDEVDCIAVKTKWETQLIDFGAVNPLFLGIDNIPATIFSIP
ncbi:MAG: hypothetical protein HND47_19685 [Chloroflexi bacterium]|nr:hypothetical protein [Chloroflexota bacterium]